MRTATITAVVIAIITMVMSVMHTIKGAAIIVNTNTSAGMNEFATSSFSPDGTDSPTYI
ncbi:MAG: hypothetical protein K2F98_02255 [Bacteroides sp.]|nr:hypothetical protein [Bacteroides sp.]